MVPRPRIATVTPAREGGAAAHRTARLRRRGAPMQPRRPPTAPPTPVPPDVPGSANGHPAHQAPAHGGEALHPRRPARATPPLEAA